jgi:WD40 repeat protein
MWLAVTSEFASGMVEVLSAATLKALGELRGHSNKVTTLTFAPDSSRFVTGSDDGTVRFWEKHVLKCVGTLRVGARVRNVAMLPDRHRLRTLCTDGWLRQ